MILSKFVDIGINVANINHFQKLGYKDLIYRHKITIPVEHLSKGSNIKIRVKCDVCGTEKELGYWDYLRSYGTYNYYACSQKCGRNKGKKTCLSKYGDENYNNREQCKETNLKLFGVDNFSKTNEFIEKCIKTNLENFGTEWGLQNIEVREKGNETKINLYGDINYNNQEKYIETMLERYGVKHPSQSKELFERGKQSKKDKYGDENYNNQEKYIETCLQKYGVKHAMQFFENIKKMIETKMGMELEVYIEQLPKYRKYKREVLSITKKQPLHVLENYEKRGYYNYHLDHMFTIISGFRENVCPYIIGNIVNLEMLTWKDNQKKHANCSLTKEQLFDRYDKRKEILKQLTEDYNSNNK